MKKYFAFFIVILINIACNDGNIAVQDISFDSVAGFNCGNISYKIKGNEVLIIKYDDISKAYLTDQTLPNAPTSLVISAANPVTYRVYNAPPTAANFCGSPVPPATPIVVEEWTATSGTIEITTTIAKMTDTATNATRISGYNNLVFLKNVTFKKPNGDQFYETFSFGNMSLSINQLNLTFADDIKQCLAPKILTAKIGAVALMSFDNSDNLIQNIATTAGNRRISTINSTTNKLIYRTFSALDPANYLCKSAFLPADSLVDEWKAVSGTVEVETTQTGLLFSHKVFLKGVKFVRKNSDFYFGDDVQVGKIETN